MNNKLSYTILCEIILKDWSFQIFKTIPLLPWQVILAQVQPKILCRVTYITSLVQQKRESFDNPEFLNQDFQLAKSKQILQLQVSPFQNLIIVVNDPRFSADFIR